jgi:hypothetical protein
MCLAPIPLADRKRIAGAPSPFALTRQQGAGLELRDAPGDRAPVDLGELGEPGERGPAAAFLVGVFRQRE